MIDHPSPRSVNCSISPPLPKDLVLSPSNVISGIVTELNNSLVQYSIRCSFGTAVSEIHNFKIAIRSGDLLSIFYSEAVYNFPFKIPKIYPAATIVGAYTGFNIDPPFPTGVYIDPVDGHLFGTLQSGIQSGKKTYKITVSNPTSKVETTIQISAIGI